MMRFVVKSWHVFTELHHVNAKNSTNLVKYNKEMRLSLHVDHINCYYKLSEWHFCCEVDCLFYSLTLPAVEIFFIQAKELL